MNQLYFLILGWISAGLFGYLNWKKPDTKITPIFLGITGIVQTLFPTWPLGLAYSLLLLVI